MALKATMPNDSSTQILIEAGRHVPLNWVERYSMFALCRPGSNEIP